MAAPTEDYRGYEICFRIMRLPPHTATIRPLGATLFEAGHVEAATEDELRVLAQTWVDRLIANRGRGS
jgi:hypothetical protein